MKPDNTEILFNKVFEESNKLTDGYEAEVLSKALAKMCIEIYFFQKLAKIDMLKKLKEEISKMSNDNPSYVHTCDVIDRDKILDLFDLHILELTETEGDTNV